MAALAPMPRFVARCLEEIALEGRCGLPVRALFALVDARADRAFREFAWRVLRSLDARQQLRFHILHPLARPAAVAPAGGGDAAPSPAAPRTRRKRKWATTLLQSEASAEELGRRAKTHQRHAVLPSMRRIAAQAERRRRLSDAAESDAAEDGADGELKKRKRKWSDGAASSEDTCADARRQNCERLPRIPSGEAVQGDNATKIDDALTPSDTHVVKDEVDGAADKSMWVFQSPRGFRLGEEVDVTGLSYADAIASSPEGVLGVVASQELRLKYLGVVDPSSIETISPQYDLLELVGRARERGENAATLAGTGLFGDARKLHYLLDMLVALNYVSKNIVTSNRRRFNIVHLARFAAQFHPSMISPDAVIERDAFPKDRLAHAIVEMLQARGVKTCVFADIGRELGYGKRHQEQLRSYFLQQMDTNPMFPLELFMARCITGSDNIGRKLWCVRLVDRSSRRSGAGKRDSSSSNGPAIERGIMEQLYEAIQDRQLAGATVPELRDILGVPTFKLPYKLAQGLISNYNISVEQVVLGKSTMYRMFAPEACAKRAETYSALDATSVPDEDLEVSTVSPQTGTIRDAVRGVVRSSTAEKRREYILTRTQQDKIVSIHQLRSGLIELERTPEQVGNDRGLIDIRSVRRILDDLESEGAVISMDITLPPKQVLQERFRVVKCVALPGCQRDRAAIRLFIEIYVKDQQQKYLAKDDRHLSSGNYIVKIPGNRGSRSGSAQDATEANQPPEVIKYTGASYKLARVHHAKLHKQSRRLGMFYGTMYRCRVLHLLLLNYTNRSRRDEMFKLHDDTCETVTSSSDSSHEAVASRAFVLKEFLDLITVAEYVQLVGMCELLTDAEEATVKSAVASGKSWDVLSGDLALKIRGLESDRFSKMLRILIELKLLKVVRRESQDLLGMFQSSDDFDSTVSKVAFATLSGGMFEVKMHTRIAIKRGAVVMEELPSPDSYVYAPTFNGKSRSDHFSGEVPLEFHFDGVEDAEDYWKALRFLSVEGAQLGRKASNGEGISVDLLGEMVRSAPIKSHNVHVFKAWVPKATTTAENSSARAKAEAAAAGPLRTLKRKRFQNPSSKSLRESALQKRRKLLKNEIGMLSTVTFVGRNEAPGDMTRRNGHAKMSFRASKWTLEEDLRLMDMYIDNMSYQWFIDIPLALQKRDEHVAFRTTCLTRSLISWKKFSKELGKGKNDCVLRVKELMDIPEFKARIERTKATITHMENPSGAFHEEVAITSSPRLTALLCRALQVILHEQSAYYAVLADMLISRWSESEVKLVWRYLWLAELITRKSRGLTEGKDLKERGFQLHSRVFRMEGQRTTRYPMSLFCRAAEHLSFLEENAREEELLDDNTTAFFEHEIEPNATPSHIAVGLAATVTGQATLTPERVDADSASIVEINTGSEPVKGLAGHLWRKCGGVSPDDFLRDYWVVKLRFHLAGDDLASASVKDTHAFSMCPDAYSSARSPLSQMRPSKAIKELISSELSTAEQSGVSLLDLVKKLPSSSRTLRVTLQRELSLMIRKGDVVEVNGYDDVRFVLKRFAEMWMLRSYRVSSDTESGKIQFIFDKHASIVARPWMHLDGTTNDRAVLGLKLKIVNTLIENPGIPDYSLHRKLRKLVGLQDLRSLLEELVADDVVYCRLHRSRAPRRPSSLFDIGATSSHHRTREEANSIEVATLGDLRYFDHTTEQLHYFPSVNCIELLGAAACDAEVDSPMA